MTTMVASVEETLCTNCFDFSATWEEQEGGNWPYTQYYPYWVCSTCGATIY